MILVHIKNSYPALIDEKGAYLNSEDLAGITLGDWPRIRRENVMPFLDMVCGVYEGRIVTAFPVSDFGYVENGERMIFSPWLPSEARTAWCRQWAWLIGSPSPGGPFGVGQARPTRRVDTDSYIQGEGAAYLGRPTPYDVNEAMLEMAAATRGLPSIITLEPRPVTDEGVAAASTAPAVDVVTGASGEIEITVRAGTRFTLTVK